MKIKVIAEAYYNDSLQPVGTIIDYKKEKLPSWATLLDGIETKKDKEKKSSSVLLPQNDGDEVIEGEGKVTTESPEAPLEEFNVIEKEEYLNKLICEGIEKGILIEDSDKKTVEEQIKELEEALKEKGE